MTPQPTDGVIALVEINICNCHPETCCCHDYRLMVGLDGLATGSRENMDKLAKLINARPAQLGGGEVSDEMVERACKAAYVVPTDFARKDMRAALEAALGKGGA